MTKDDLKKGVDVIVVGAVSPRAPWNHDTAGQAGEHSSVQLEERPRGKVVKWSESRFGGTFVEVKIGKDVSTVALTDLALAS